MNAVAETVGEGFFAEKSKWAAEKCVVVGADLEEGSRGICEVETGFEGDGYQSSVCWIGRLFFYRLCQYFRCYGC